MGTIFSIPTRLFSAALASVCVLTLLLAVGAYGRADIHPFVIGLLGRIITVSALLPVLLILRVDLPIQGVSLNRLAALGIVIGMTALRASIGKITSLSTSSTMLNTVVCMIANDKLALSLFPNAIDASINIRSGISRESTAADGDGTLGAAAVGAIAGILDRTGDGTAGDGQNTTLTDANIGNSTAIDDSLGRAILVSLNAVDSTTVHGDSTARNSNQSLRVVRRAHGTAINNDTTASGGICSTIVTG